MVDKHQNKMPPKQASKKESEVIEIKEEKDEESVIDLVSDDKLDDEKVKQKTKKRHNPFTDAIPKAAFRRMVKEIAGKYKTDLRWEAEALEALQVDAETYLLEQFHRANKARVLCKHLTLGKNHWAQAVTNL